MQYDFITIEGNIGAGKTTLATALSKKLNARLVLEAFADNPFLPKFYEHPQQYAFPLELFFMAERYKQLQELLAQRSIFQKLTISDYLFTKSLLFAKVTLSEDEYKLYQRLFEIVQQQLVQPQLLIYLHAPVRKLQENIKKRQRSYEQKIPDDYLYNIQETYLQYIKQLPFPILFIDASHADFINTDRHLTVIIDALDQTYDRGIHPIYLP
ncbi:deoxynucleoside kinase [Niabella ginsenosidivorans]|uniref:Deoxynucleoside kinase n=1 Tax=Niabella ginsenosidivorans TaxID=1176587 RepID=A0A1A9I0D1_9BACT|nr:deoxynucleoside kinase [Niabella ginsenosidivorans]ANH80142.1 deoxynucleoside kinase [Niabella ginsenosidivorans]